MDETCTEETLRLKLKQLAEEDKVEYWPSSPRHKKGGIWIYIPYELSTPHSLLNLLEEDFDLDTAWGIYEHRRDLVHEFIRNKTHQTNMQYRQEEASKEIMRQFEEIETHQKIIKMLIKAKAVWAVDGGDRPYDHDTDIKYVMEKLEKFVQENPVTVSTPKHIVDIMERKGDYKRWRNKQDPYLEGFYDYFMGSKQ